MDIIISGCEPIIGLQVTHFKETCADHPRNLNTKIERGVHTTFAVHLFSELSEEMGSIRIDHQSDHRTVTMADSQACLETDATADELKPQILNANHQDSLFGNSFTSRSYYVVHPEWISEAGSNPQPDPLHRLPWPWEQPRYRVNMQVPITYKAPQEAEMKKEKSEDKEKREREEEEDRFLQEEIPPISYQLSQMYKSTHPQYMMRY
ncbi:hypothetical protein RRG08_011979 [Elysia crispata]|uniref:Uncharacterized protein n=1 Tax=Elysia crispata TaxID=231223 RepID=A0AAE1DG66_9GAST|nr:hypothetical protein RRG08_011979 [Elysia crispata]